MEHNSGTCFVFHSCRLSSNPPGQSETHLHSCTVLPMLPPLGSLGQGKLGLPPLPSDL